MSYQTLQQQETIEILMGGNAHVSGSTNTAGILKLPATLEEVINHSGASGKEWCQGQGSTDPLPQGAGRTRAPRETGVTMQDVQFPQNTHPQLRGQRNPAVNSASN